MALQVAMGPYNMTARSISDKDMERTLQLIGADAPSFETAVASMTGEIERSMVTPNKNFPARRLMTSLDITELIDDPDNPGQKKNVTRPILITSGDYIEDPDNTGEYILSDRYTKDPGVGMGAANELERVNTALRNKYTALITGGPPGSTRVLNTVGNIDKTVLALEDMKDYMIGVNGNTVTFNRGEMNKEFTLNVNALNDQTIIGKLTKDALMGTPETIKQQTLFRLYQNNIAPLMDKKNFKEVEENFFKAYGMTQEEKDLFTNYYLLIQEKLLQ